MSLEHLENFESALPPIEFIGDSGRESVYRDGLLMTTCPCCGAEMWALPSGFLCSSRNCAFRAGSVLDFVAYEMQDGSFQRAVTELWPAAGGALDFFSAYDPHDVIPGIASYASLRRRFMELFLRLNLLPGAPNAPLAAAQAWMTKNDITPEANAMTALPAAGEEVSQLLQLSAQLGHNKAVPPGGGVLFPYYGNHHSVAYVIFYSIRRKLFFDIPAFPFRFSFCGLLEGSPLMSPRVSTNKITAAKLNSIYASEHKDNYACAVLRNRHGFLTSVTLNEPCYMYLPDEPLGAAAAYSLVAPDLKVKLCDSAIGSEEVAPTNWTAFMLQELLRMISERGFGEAAKTLLGASKLGRADQGRLLAALRRNALFDAVDALEEHLQAAPVYQDENWSLYSTPSGYSAAKGEAIRKTITNFTLELDTNLVFTDSPDLFHSGGVLFQGRYCPLLLEHKHLDNPKDIESVIRGAEAKTAGTNDHTVLPAVVERSGLKLLASHLRVVTARLPRGHGLSYLGWNGARDRFCAPSWQVKEEKFNTKFTFHPDVEVLRYFSPEPPPDVVHKGALQPGFCGLIAQLVAMTARGYLDLPLSPLRIQDTPEARKTLLGIFAGLGQREIYRLSFSARYAEEIRNLCGFPILAAGYSSGQIDRSKLPAVILADDGAAFSTGIQDEEIALAAGVLRRALQAVALWLLQTEGKEFVRHRSISNDVEITREGQHLLKTVCKFERWPDAPIRYQMLEKLLESIPAIHVGNFFQHHLGDQKVFLFVTPFKETVDLTTLELELRGRCEKFERVGSYFVMDALTATQILNNYYQGQAFPSPIAEVPLDPGSPAESVAAGVRGLRQ